MPEYSSFLETVGVDVTLGISPLVPLLAAVVILLGPEQKRGSKPLHELPPRPSAWIALALTAGLLALQSLQLATVSQLVGTGFPIARNRFAGSQRQLQPRRTERRPRLAHPDPKRIGTAPPSHLKELTPTPSRTPNDAKRNTFCRPRGRRPGAPAGSLPHRTQLGMGPPGRE